MIGYEYTSVYDWGRIMEKLFIKDNIDIKKIRDFVISLCVLLVISPLNLIYMVLNKSNREVHSLVLAADNMIPFVKLFILPYVGWYAFIFLTMAYLCYKDRETYFITLTTYVLGLLASFITFYLFQTTVPRPEIAGNDILTKLILLIYNADKPYNCFPSIHVLTSYLMFKAIMRSDIKNKLNLSVIGISSAFIIISTLFVKQHVILDVISGVIYADILFRVVELYGVRLWISMRKQYNLVLMKKKLETQ